MGMRLSTYKNVSKLDNIGNALGNTHTGPAGSLILQFFTCKTGIVRFHGAVVRIEGDGVHGRRLAPCIPSDWTPAWRGHGSSRAKSMCQAHTLGKD